jgi:pimeloyl-ACP methyl ester carboxylesterase
MISVGELKVMAIRDNPHRDVRSDVDVSSAVERALTCDPFIDRCFPPETLACAIPSDGVNLNAVLYTAAGAGPHPTVVLLHGLPGNEQNVDLAQSVRRAGWNVLTFHYRGSWGSPGRFSFANCLEDATAVIGWLQRVHHVAGFRIEPNAFAVIGHSMGGFIAAYVAAHHPIIKAAALISAADLGSAFGDLPFNQAVSVVDENVGTSTGLHILAGTSPRALAAEASANAAQWRLCNFADRLDGRPLLICTSDDGFAAGNRELADAMSGSTARPERTHFSTDHSYSDHRLALQRRVLGWLLSTRGSCPC